MTISLKAFDEGKEDNVWNVSQGGNVIYAQSLAGIYALLCTNLKKISSNNLRILILKTHISACSYRLILLFKYKHNKSFNQYF